jgi:F-type H+-transporting ATPase subunit gamma
MASAKDVKKKIRTISNTRKITRTMEMVATVRSKKAQNRIRATGPYAEKLSGILRNLALSGSISHPLMESAPEPGNSSVVSSSHGNLNRGTGFPALPQAEAAPKPILVLVVTGNRGLCGGYNSNVLEVAHEWALKEREGGRELEIHVIGKKGMLKLRFLKVPMAKVYPRIGDDPRFADAEEIAQELMRRFRAGELERVVIVSTRYLSASSQKPRITQLLPVPNPRAPEAAEGAAEGGPAPAARRKGKPAPIEFDFEPGRGALLESLIPLSVKFALYKLLLEAAASEQIARRVAMKMATDNAEEMIRVYTRKYNRQRQAGITQQIVEVVSGAQALE